jgi:hypothetical protein
VTPEEILNDLRDIHLPDAMAETAGIGFVYWPALLVIALTVLAIGLGWRRRSAWRRDIVRRLDAIERDASEGRVREGWTALALLLRRVAIGLAERQDVAGLIGDAWLEKLDHLFKTDVFCRGPGRGVIVFPYGAAARLDPEKRDQLASQLNATISDVRKRLPNLRTATWSS